MRILKYTRMQREEANSFITIGEYIFETNPKVFYQLYKMYLVKHGIDQYLSKLVSGFCLVTTFSRNVIDQLMREPPKPGRGGLLPGEGEEAL